MEKKIVKKVKPEYAYKDEVFVSTDGKEFDTEYKCKLHEISLLIKNLKQFTVSIFGIYPEAYRAVTDEDAQNLFRYYDWMGKVHGKFTIGWNFVTQEYAGDNAHYTYDYYVWNEAGFLKDVETTKKLIEAKNE